MGGIIAKRLNRGSINIMGDILRFPEPAEKHGYTMSGDTITGVYYKDGEDIIEIPLSGDLYLYQDGAGMCNEIPKEDIKDLLIMWLAMLDPSVLKYDDE